MQANENCLCFGIHCKLRLLQSNALNMNRFYYSATLLICKVEVQ